MENFTNLGMTKACQHTLYHFIGFVHKPVCLWQQQASRILHLHSGRRDLFGPGLFTYTRAT